MFALITTLGLAGIFLPEPAMAAALAILGGGGTYLANGAGATGQIKNGTTGRVAAIAIFKPSLGEWTLGLGGTRVAITDTRDSIERELVQNSPYLDAAAYWPIAESGMALGIGLEVFIGTGVYLNYDEPEATQTASFVGPRLKYQYPIGSLTALAILQYAMSSGIPDEEAAALTLFAGLKIDIGAPDARPMPEPPPLPTPEEDRVRDHVVTILDARVLNFERGKSALPKASLALIGRVGKMLKDNLKLWALLKVKGHTDEQGNNEFDYKLSLDRANAVKAALSDAGVPHERMTSQGYGSAMPLPGTEPFSSENRRVEFDFEGVIDRANFDLLFKEAVSFSFIARRQ